MSTSGLPAAALAVLHARHDIDSTLLPDREDTALEDALRAEYEALRSYIADQTDDEHPLHQLAKLILSVSSPSFLNSQQDEEYLAHISQRFETLAGIIKTTSFNPTYSSVRGIAVIAHVFEEGLFGARVDEKCAEQLYKVAVIASTTRASAVPRVSYFAHFSLACMLTRNPDGNHADSRCAKNLFETVIANSAIPCAPFELANLILTHFPPQAADEAINALEQECFRYPSARIMDCLLEKSHNGCFKVTTSEGYARWLCEKSIDLHGFIYPEPVFRLARILAYSPERTADDVIHAVRLLEKLPADHKRCETMTMLGTLLVSTSAGALRDVSRGVQLLESAAKEGNEQAISVLAQVYSNGDAALPRDHKRALQLYEVLLACDGDNGGLKREKFQVAFLISSGIDESIPQDYSRAVRLYEELLADGADGDVLFTYAALLIDERAGLMDYSRSVELFELAIANYQDSRSMEALGLILLRGLGDIKKDKLRGIQLLEEVAESGSREALIEVGIALAGDLHEAPTDLGRGMRIMTEAKDNLHDLASILHLAIIYAYGRGDIEPDIDRAVQLNEEGIAVGIRNVEELHTIGIRREPIVVDSEDPKMWALYQYRLKGGVHLVIMRNLAELYIANIPGLPMNVERCVLLLTRALTDRNSRSTFSWRQFDDFLVEIVKMTHMSEAGEDRFVNAVKMYELIIDVTDQNSHAMYLLARLLLYGADGVEQDSVRAHQLLERAVAKGHKDAMVTLGELLVREKADLEPMQSNRRAIELFAKAASDEDHNAWDVRRTAVVNIAMLALRMAKDTARADGQRAPV